MARYRVAVDTGGTFSDFVYLDEETGEVSIAKVPSTPDDPSRAILARHRGADRARRARRRSRIISATARRSAPTRCSKARACGPGSSSPKASAASMTSAEQARPYGTAIFDVMYDKPALLVPPSRTGEVAERVDFRGNVLHALDEAALRETVARPRRADGSSRSRSASCSRFFIPQHEARVREIILRGNARTAASRCRREILPQIREYYRL